MLLYPRVIELGKPLFSDVSDERTDLHQWLSRRLTGRPMRLVGHKRTIYLDSDQLVNHPELLAEWLRRSQVDEADNDVVLVLDLSTNSYDLMREPVIYELSLFAAAWAAGRDGAAVVVLMPKLPPARVSLFWRPLQAFTGSSAIHVYGNDGRSWSRAGYAAAETPTGREYARRLAALGTAGTGDADSLAAQISRELGHFPVGNGERRYCARYFFDAELIVADIARLLVERVTRLGLAEQQIVLLTHGAHSDWLHKAALIAGSGLPSKPAAANITHRDDHHALAESGVTALPIFDVINGGSTCARVVGELHAQGVALTNEVIAVIEDQHRPDIALPGGIQVEKLLTVSCRKTPREECPQCRLGLPFTEPLSTDYKCRPYDMWEILLGVDWPPEDYGPAEVALFDSAPHMGDVFDAHGDWLSYKIFRLLEGKVAHSEIVVVCPEEVRIDRLVEKLSRRLQERVVIVRIPRAALAGGAAPTTGTVPGWRVQLEHVAHAGRRSVVIIDEFNASDSTARSMIALLGKAGVEVDLYVPILNRVPPELSSLPFEVHALYDIPSPRQRGRA